VAVGADGHRGRGAGGELACIRPAWAEVGTLSAQDARPRRCEGVRVVGRDEYAAAVAQGARQMTPAGPYAGLSPSLADFGDAEVAKAEAAIESRPSAAGPYAISPVQAEAIPPVEAIDIPPVHAPDIKVPEINANGEQAERP
jgi:hypothetical protein